MDGSIFYDDDHGGDIRFENLCSAGEIIFVLPKISCTAPPAFSYLNEKPESSNRFGKTQRLLYFDIKVISITLNSI